MSKKDIARIACFIAILQGGIMPMLRGGAEDGPLVAVYRLALFLGGVIGLCFLGFSWQGSQDLSECANEGSGENAASGQSSGAEWKGYCQGNPFVKGIVLVIAVLLVCTFIFLMF